MTEQQAKMVLAYAKGSMRARAAASEVFVTAGDVHYQFKKIKQETGLDPKNFFDLCRLVGIAASITGGI